MNGLKRRKLLNGFGVLIVVLIVVALAGVASAGASFSNFTGPTWLNPGYRWTVDATLTNPDKQVCIEYSVNGGASIAAQCTCAGAGCASTPSVGSWTCTAPSPLANVTGGTIAWRVGSWTAGGGSSCGAEQNLAGSGTTTTGPSAVTLSSLDAARETSTWRMAAIAVVGLTGLGASLWWARSCRQPLAG